MRSLSDHMRTVCDGCRGQVIADSESLESVNVLGVPLRSLPALKLLLCCNSVATCSSVAACSAARDAVEIRNARPGLASVPPWCCDLISKVSLAAEQVATLLQKANFQAGSDRSSAKEQRRGTLLQQRKCFKAKERHCCNKGTVASR